MRRNDTSKSINKEIFRLTLKELLKLLFDKSTKVLVNFVFKIESLPIPLYLWNLGEVNRSTMRIVQ